MLTEEEKKRFITLQLRYLNDYGEFHCGSPSSEDKLELELFLESISEEERSIFFLKYIKHEFLSDSDDHGYGLDDLDEVRAWIRHTFEQK